MDDWGGYRLSGETIREAIATLDALTRERDQNIKKALATAFVVWHKWKGTLPDGAFSHDDGVRFVAMLTQAMPTPLPPAPSTRGPEGV